MCAILGIGFLNGHRIKNFDRIKKLLELLFVQSQVRGNRATGVAVVTDNDIDVLKNNISAHKFVDTKEFKDLFDKRLGENSSVISIIGHCRFPTKGTDKNNDNNHPITTKNIVGVHNGVIINDDELFDEFSKFAGEGWKREGEVDSEIIFRLVDYFAYSQSKTVRESIESTVNNIQGGFACALTSRLNKRSIWLFKNHSPISICFFPKSGIIIFASSKGYIDTAIVGADLGRIKEITLEADQGVEIDLYRNLITRFKTRRSTYGGLYTQ